MTRRQKKRNMKSLKQVMAYNREANKDEQVWNDKGDKENEMRLVRRNKRDRIARNRKRRHQSWLKRRLAKLNPVESQ